MWCKLNTDHSDTVFCLCPKYHDVENKIYVFFVKNENLRQRKVVEKLPQSQKTVNCCCCYYCHLIENTIALAYHNNSDTITLQYIIQNNTYVLYVFFQHG